MVFPSREPGNTEPITASALINLSMLSTFSFILGWVNYSSGNPCATNAMILVQDAFNEGVLRKCMTLKCKDEDGSKSICSQMLCLKGIDKSAST